MHLLIDVRTSSPSDIPHLYYGEMWADIWKTYHPHDRLTFLAHTGDPVDEQYECVFVSRTWWLFGKKKVASHEHGPDRIISFSRLPSIDLSIPTILHVHDLTSHLYGDTTSNILKKKYEEYSYKKLLQRARHIIVAHIDIGRELGELYGIEEARMSVIPYLTPLDRELQKRQTLLPHGISGIYSIAEGTPYEEWNPLGLIRAYTEYLQRKKWVGNLIILWDIGANLGNITLMIRSLDMISSIKIVGIVSRAERDALYAHASSWIYAGYHYSRWASVNMASSYSVPLFLSDISWLRDYAGTFFHPNHTDTLATILSVWSTTPPKVKKPNNDRIMEVYTRIIAE